MRIGIGVDVHQFADHRKLILGGVEIQHPQGLLGHSDADVLSHAVGDALLGAAGMGDLGSHFPDSDPQWKDANSLHLLRKIVKILKDKGLGIEYVDTTVICQSPKIAPYRGKMIENLAKALEMEENKIHVKATTTEGLGFEGRGEGISAWAVALLS